MLSSVLKSEKAIEVIKMREMLLAHKELREKLEKMERKYDKRFRTVFTVLKGLLKEEAIMPVAKIGFSDKK